jgi:glyoxylase-like metal-dependent hydrolase (beta-lactamase superfamily II)
MKTRTPIALVCLALLTAAAWLSSRERPEAPLAWTEVSPGVWRSPGSPASYAILDGENALLIDAAAPVDGLAARGVKKIEMALLTHHHRDTVAHAAKLLADRVPVRAPKASTPWLTPEGVRTYWKESLPLRNSRTAYLVLPEGLDGIECSLADGQTIAWRGWELRVIETPGHSRDHVSLTARKGEGPLLLFAGDALASPGTMWSPYTTDWDHWTDQGLKPTAESLRKLAALSPAVLLPAHGDVIRKDAARALTQTADAVAEVGFLKSFERFTKERLKDAPTYAFLAKEQAESNGSKPWTRVSEHLWLTGNTYVLVSKENVCLVVDPWDPHSAKQIPKLREEQKLGPIEVALCSHAHFDHYDGVYSLLDREMACKVWTLDRVAVPIADPGLLRAPFLDPRPLRIDRRFKDGDSATWREYRLRFHFLPGQTEFTMGVETTIDGKRCFFTADNWFHQDQFSGSGGWMGLNRSFPIPYSESASKVLEAKPDWVLAEHGGPFEFNAEDWRRRVEWGKAGARAADALSPSGNHRHDWDPHRIRIEPVLMKGQGGQTLKATLVCTNRLQRPRTLAVTLEGRGLLPDRRWDVTVEAGGEVRKDFTLTLPDRLPAGRHVFAVRVAEGETVDPCDAFLALDVGP